MRNRANEKINIMSTNATNSEVSIPIDPFIEYIEKLERDNERLLNACNAALEVLYAPDPNCSCHISPPCNDCVEYRHLREVIDQLLEATGV